MEVNADQALRVVDKLRSQLGTLDSAVVAVWGIAFKPNTDDIRESPAIQLMNLLEQEGAQVRAFDPVAMPKAAPHLPSVTLCQDPYEAAAAADALLLATEWDSSRRSTCAGSLLPWPAPSWSTAGTPSIPTGPAPPGSATSGWVERRGFQ